MEQAAFDALTPDEVASLAQEQRAKFMRLARAGLPFNPVSVEDIAGQNVTRLQNSMKMFGWSDPRFATEAQAIANGWTIGHDAVVVETKVRNTATGLVEEVGLINAKNLNGMPSLSAMLAMADHELLTLQGIKPAGVTTASEMDLVISPQRELTNEIVQDRFSAESKKEEPAAFRVMSSHGFAPYQDDPNKPVGYFVELAKPGQPSEKIWTSDIEKSLQAGGIAVGEALAMTLDTKQPVDIDAVREDGSSIRTTVDRWAMWEDSKKVVLDKLGSSRTESTPESAPTGNLAGIGQRLAVIAPYWQDGLHNAQGIELAKELNRVIRERGLAEERDAIARLMALHADAQRLGLQITSEKLYLSDPDLKENRAEPASLQKGRLVRDKSGAYRPAAGGLPVLVDQGESLTLKTKAAEGYRAAMELALAKGWTAIELTGKPAMLSDAWLEAKLLGLDVVNYSPTKKDLERFGVRLAAEQKKVVEQPVVVDQAPETVEIRPFVDAAGHLKTATVTYTVTPGGVPDVGTTGATISAGDSAAGAPALPAVTRTTTRVDGEVVQSDIDVSDDLVGEIAEEFGKALGEVRTEARSDTVDGLGMAASFADGVFELGTPDRLQLNAVLAFQIAHGDDWKDKLSASWGHGNYRGVDKSQAALLQQVRNQFGPEWLDAVTVADLVAIEPVKEGQHIGPILAVKDGMFQQSIGRGATVWHAISSLDSPSPKVGDMAEIRYADGRGVVKGGQEQGHGLDAGIGR